MKLNTNTKDNKLTFHEKVDWAQCSIMKMLPGICSMVKNSLLSFKLAGIMPAYSMIEVN